MMRKNLIDISLKHIVLVIKLNDLLQSDKIEYNDAREFSNVATSNEAINPNAIVNMIIHDDCAYVNLILAKRKYVPKFLLILLELMLLLNN